MSHHLPRMAFCLLIPLIGSWGCSHPVEAVEQPIRLQVAVPDDSPLKGQPFRLAEGDRCTAAPLSGKTDDAGVIQWHRASRRGTYAVLLDKLALCSMEGDQWTPVWSASVDTGVPLDIRCAWPKEGAIRCDHGEVEDFFDLPPSMQGG